MSNPNHQPAPSQSPALETVPVDLPPGFRAITVFDHNADTSYLERVDFEDRRAAYENGDFAFVGVLLQRQCSACEEWLNTSYSLWSVESDSDSTYFAEIARDLMSEYEKGMEAGEAAAHE